MLKLFFFPRHFHVSSPFTHLFSAYIFSFVSFIHRGGAGVSWKNRISVVFRVRSAKAVKITDATLLKRLGVICLCVGIGLLVRTIVAPPVVIVGRTADDLKAFLCKADWWDHTFTTSKFEQNEILIIIFDWFIRVLFCYLATDNTVDICVFGLIGNWKCYHSSSVPMCAPNFFENSW